MIINWKKNTWLIEGINQTISADSLERLGQEEALLHVIVGWVGWVDIFDPGETAAHPAVLVDGLEQERRRRKELVQVAERKRTIEEENEGKESFNKLIKACYN